MPKVIIYGFGVVGKNLFRFLLDTGIPYAIANDEIIEYYSDDVKMDHIENINIEKDDIIAICTTHDAYKKAMLSKVKNALGGLYNAKQVIYYANAGYSHKYLSYMEVKKIQSAVFNPIDFCTIAEKAISDASAKYDISKKAKNEKYRAIVSANKNSGNIFQEIHKTKLNDKPDMIKYPFFSVYFSDKSKDKEFGFREPIDWDLVQNPEFRAKNKLICVFGNSQVHGASIANNDETFPCLLESTLNKNSNETLYKVLNCAHNGDTILEEIAFYVTLIDKIKPDMVISVSGIDFTIAQKCDKNLIEKHAYFYKGYEEKIYKEYFQSAYPLPGETGELREPNMDVVYKNFFYRIKQFERIVNSNGGAFIFCLQPSIYSKKLWTSDELQKTVADFNLNKINAQEKSLLEQMDKFSSEFVEYAMQSNVGVRYFLDLNSLIADEENSCFDDWIHLNDYGNSLVARAVSDMILSNKLGE